MDKYYHPDGRLKLKIREMIKRGVLPPDFEIPQSLAGGPDEVKEGDPK